MISVRCREENEGRRRRRRRKVNWCWWMRKRGGTEACWNLPRPGKDVHWIHWHIGAEMESDGNGTRKIPGKGATSLILLLFITILLD